MPYRPMTEQEIEEINMRIEIIKHQIEQQESFIARLEAEKEQGVWYFERKSE